MFNNSPAYYRNICSACVQILGDLSVWTQKLCFSEVKNMLFNLNHKILPLHISTQFLSLKYILFT